MSYPLSESSLSFSFLLFSSHLCLPVAVFKRQVSHSVCKNTKWAENNTKCSALYRGGLKGVIFFWGCHYSRKIWTGEKRAPTWKIQAAKVVLHRGCWISGHKKQHYADFLHPNSLLLHSFPLLSCISNFLVPFFMLYNNSRVPTGFGKLYEKLWKIICYQSFAPI